MNNYMMYMGAEGIYTHTVAYEKDAECAQCGAGICLSVGGEKTLEEVMAMVAAHPRVAQSGLAAPSVSYGAKNLYMQGPLEEATRPNLKRQVKELLQADKAVLSINDKKLPQTLRLNLTLQ